MQLETQRLILRKPTPADVDDYMEFVNSRFVMRYNAMEPVTRERAEAEFANTRDDLGTLALELKATGKVIGMIYTHPDSLRYRVASKEFSYFLREEEAGKGYMKEALGCLIAHLFEAEQLSCVAARCFLPNVASRRLLESLGFQREGVIRNCVKGFEYTVFDDCLYSLIKEDL